MSICWTLHKIWISFVIQQKWKRKYVHPYLWLIKDFNEDTSIFTFANRDSSACFVISWVKRPVNPFPVHVFLSQNVLGAHLSSKATNALVITAYQCCCRRVSSNPPRLLDFSDDSEWTLFCSLFSYSFAFCFSVSPWTCSVQWSARESCEISDVWRQLKRSLELCFYVALFIAKD